jgi:inosine-uridine nucleoside N-ribohydrolase
MKIKTLLMLSVLLGGMLSSCSNDDDEGKDKPEVAKVILDADIPSSTDDLFSLQMLYRYADEGKCQLLGVVVDREDKAGAEVTDIMNTYYGYGDVPIALVKEGIDEPQVWIDYSPLATHTKADGTPMFRRTLASYDNLPDGWQLYRRLLAAEPDHSVSICSVGFLTALAQLLQSEGDEHSPLNGIELVRRKVKAIYVMGGVFGDAIEPDFNFGQGITFAQSFFSLWPSDVPIYFSAGEVGDAIEYAPEQVMADLAWDTNHPIRQVYEHYDCNTGQKMWDPLAVIHAVEGDDLFTLSQPGIVTLTPQAETIFTADPNGNSRYQIPGTAEWNEMMLEKIRKSGERF